METLRREDPQFVDGVKGSYVPWPSSGTLRLGSEERCEQCEGLFGRMGDQGYLCRGHKQGHWGHRAMPLVHSLVVVGPCVAAHATRHSPVLPGP